MANKKIVVLTTGGTIASAHGSAGLSRSGAMSGEELMAMLQVTSPLEAEIEVRTLLQKPSNAITLADLLLLRNTCQAVAAEPGVVGIVVTHGTDTLEETAYFLDITLNLEGCALVVTGSQRAPHQVASDAHRNLADALLVAGTAEASQLGVVVVFHESLYAARHVRKVHSYQLDGFHSPEFGKLGFVDSGRVFIEQLPVRRPCLRVGDTLPRVDILPVYIEAATDLLDASLATGSRGIVIEGVGRGHAPPDWLAAVERAQRQGVPVVVTSGCQQGPVHQSYEFPGSLASLEANGAVAAHNLSARKARLKLAALLSHPENGGGASVRQHFVTG
ncbi:MAG TPA: asparaginase [Gammaproteobacteria bacterium]|nr:asparaginase [Gammaproteobacteria bacterium]